jgi:hypothetical protein
MPLYVILFPGKSACQEAYRPQIRDTARRYRLVQIQTGDPVITAADPCPKTFAHPRRDQQERCAPAWI